MGYHNAGFDVIGFDIKPQPNYPFPFIQADALDVWRHKALLGRTDAIHASPPCQHYANVTLWRGQASDHPALIAPVRKLLDETDLPYVIENVRTKEIRADLVLCGSQFDLGIRRHRYFESNVAMPVLTEPCRHRLADLPFEHKREREYADRMGCMWMSTVEAREAIPPAYTEFIGAELLEHLERVA